MRLRYFLRNSGDEVFAFHHSALRLLLLFFDRMCLRYADLGNAAGRSGIQFFLDPLTAVEAALGHNQPLFVVDYTSPPESASGNELLIKKVEFY